MTTTTLSRSLARYRVLDRINVQAIGGAVIRYGLVGVIGWIGLMKFTRVEAEAIWPLAEHSPLMSWASTALGVQPFSNLVGVAEVTIAVLIALRGATASIRFMQAFGVVYLLTGAIGFVMLGSQVEGHLLHLVHINWLDNYLHVGLGIAIASAGWVSRRHTNRPVVTSQA